MFVLLEHKNNGEAITRDHYFLFQLNNVIRPNFPEESCITKLKERRG